jgi:hypothetical protein
MTVPSEVDVVVTPSDADHTSYVDWPAIIAGIVVAAGISIVLLAFGSAIGLSMTDFRAGDDVNPIWIAIAAAIWLLWVQISSFMAGGYLTGRLRKRHQDATEHEVDVRDGAHGLIVWGGALVIGGLIAAGGLGAVATAVGSAASTLTTAASNVAGEAADSAADPTAYFVDMLFRPGPAGAAAATTTTETTTTTTETPAATTEAPATTTEAPAATTEAPAATTETPAATTTEAPAATTEAPAATTPAPATPAEAPAAPGNADAADEAAPTVGTTTQTDTTEVRAEAGRIFVASAVAGELPADDRTYLAQVVAANTGLSDEEAQARVDQVVTAIDNAKAQAAEAAETARKTGVLAAFLTAASLLVSAVGAFWAAQKGGQHRDEGTVFANVFRRF